MRTLPVALAAILAATLVVVGRPAVGLEAAAPGQVVLEGPLAEGVWYIERHEPGPLRTIAVQVEPGAGVNLVPVVAGDSVRFGRETVSSMCDRAGGAACVNANFPICPSCTEPFGAIVQNAQILKSPTPLQDQVSLVNGELTSDRFRWSAGMWVLGAEQLPSVEFDAINTGPVADGIVLYTSAYGPSTGFPAGGYELVVGASQPLWTGAGVRQPVGFQAVSGAGDTAIAPGSMVIAAHGAAVEVLRSFAEAHANDPVELVVNSTPGLEMSIGGHPTLLRDGVALPLDPRDNKVRVRHPRTLLGWDDGGRTWLVVVDGRASHSRGMTLGEATAYMRGLGATHAVNLDGGGSSTLSTPCLQPRGVCTRNAPSDGRERPVWVSLALVPNG